MGTYKKIRIDANTNDKKKLDTIAHILEKHEAEDCWQKFCEDTKWWPDDMIKELTEKLPKVMFCVQYAGEETSTHYIYGGAWVQEHFLWHGPRYPSVQKFNEAKNRKIKRDKTYRQRRKEADRKIAAKEKQIKKLEADIHRIDAQV